jgi:hypothetical protein
MRLKTIAHSPLRLASSLAVLVLALSAGTMSPGSALAEDTANPFGAAAIVAEDDLGSMRATNGDEGDDITNNIVNNNQFDNSGDAEAEDGAAAVIGNQNETASASDNSAAANNGDAIVVNIEDSEDVIAGSDNTVGMAESTGEIDLTDVVMGDLTSGSISGIQIQEARGITNVWSNTGMFSNMIGSTVVNVNLH